jgi:hypothetical protein
MEDMLSSVARHRQGVGVRSRLQRRHAAAGHRRAKLANLDAPIGAAMWAALEPAIAMEQGLALKDMVDAVAKTMKANGMTVLVGAVGMETIKRLEEIGHTPESADIWLRDAEFLHALRDAKTARFAHFPLNVWCSLSARLKSAKPWFDTKDPALIYIFDVGGDVGKVAVRVNYREKVRDAAGNRHRVKSNFIRTGGLVDAQHITEPAYIPLFDK